MTNPEAIIELPEPKRREIFLALVTAQDQGIGVRPSRGLVAKEHAISVAQVEEIEREGMDQQWPPLDDAA